MTNIPASASERNTSTFRIGERFDPNGAFPHGFWIPYQLAKYRDISDSSKMLWGWLRFYARKNRSCYPSIERLADDMGMSPRQIKRYIKELESHRLIERERRMVDGKRSSDTFFFVWHEALAHLWGDKSGKDSLPNLSPKEYAVVEQYDLTCPTPLDARIDLLIREQFPHVRGWLKRFVGDRSPHTPTPPMMRDFIKTLIDRVGTVYEEEIRETLNYMHALGMSRNANYELLIMATPDRMEKLRRRKEAANPEGFHAWEYRNLERDLSKEATA